MKYKINFSGFAYVEADSKEEAIDCMRMDVYDYSEQEVTSVEEVDEFVVEV